MPWVIQLKRLLILFLITLLSKSKPKSCDLVIKPNKLRGIIAEFDIKVGKDIIVEQGRRITAKHAKILQDAKVESISAPLGIFDWKSYFIRCN